MHEIKHAYLEHIQKKLETLRGQLVSIQTELELNPFNARANDEYKFLAYEIKQLEKHIAQVSAD